MLSFPWIPIPTLTCETHSFHLPLRTSLAWDCVDSLTTALAPHTLDSLLP